ncbi:MAG: hypothetical protein QOH76_2236 [Thermoleophilaceae bacterium]|jgi:hypothetical protein|nr:hypothetical protein [Thermoleophilaceae bacterium]
MSGPEARRDTDLERIESALAAGRADAPDPRERELQELALALRADSAEPRPAFAQQLERRVGEGFAKPPRRRRVALPSVWPALAAATALIAVAVVAIAVFGGGREQATVSAQKSGPASFDALNGAGASSQELRPFSRNVSPAPVLTSSRRVERSTRLTISTPRGELQRAADGVGTVAESHHGFVLRSQVNTGDAGDPGGSFTLRVPVTELQSTLADLSKLGRLRARSEDSHDLTAPYNGVQLRLGNALIEHRALKLKLRRAHGAKADRIRIQLATLKAEVESLNTRIGNLHKRTAFSTVYLTLEQDGAGAGTGGGGTGAAWHDALDTLEGVFNFAVRALGILLPLGLLAALGAFGTRVLRRRRREGVLA